MHHRFTNRLANPASGPDSSVPATGCAGARDAHDWAARLERGNHRAFDRPNIRDDRPRSKRRRNRAPDRFVRSDRHAEDDAVGATDDPGEIVCDEVAEPQRLGPLQDRSRMVGEHDPSRRIATARRAGDRGADQADADNREFVEDRLGERRPRRSLNHFGPHELGERGDHAPVGLFAAHREPERIRKPVSRHRSRMKPRALKNASASAAVRPDFPGRSGAGNFQRSASPRSRASRSPLEPGQPVRIVRDGALDVGRRLRCWRRLPPCAAPFRLNGPRTRFNASRT